MIWNIWPFLFVTSSKLNIFVCYENEFLRWKRFQFQELPFYNAAIEKPKIRGLINIDLFQKLPFYDELNIMPISKAFGWYAKIYKVEIVGSKDPLAHLEATKSSIRGLFKDLSDEIKGFKYQITVKALLRKDKQNGDIEFFSDLF